MSSMMVVVVIDVGRSVSANVSSSSLQGSVCTWTWLFIHMFRSPGIDTDSHANIRKQPENAALYIVM